MIPWPGLAARPVILGGAVVTVADAQAAVAVLTASRSSAIRALLRAAGNPLHACDYHAVYGPYLAAARASLEPTHRRGCAGRHLAKAAFCQAAADAVEAARAALLAEASAALAADHRIAAAMAADAVACRRRDHARKARDQVRAAVEAAVRECRSRPGVTCARETACGTGDCPFAPSWARELRAAAPPGRRPRPPGHVSGGTFSESAAVEDWLAARPYRPLVTVSDRDFAAAGELAA